MTHTPWSPISTPPGTDTPNEPGWPKKPDPQLEPGLPSYLVTLLEAIRARDAVMIQCLAQSQDPVISAAGAWAARCIPETPVYLEALFNPAKFEFPTDPQARLYVLNWMRHDPAPEVQTLIKKVWALLPKETRDAWIGRFSQW